MLVKTTDSNYQEKIETYKAKGFVEYTSNKKHPQQTVISDGIKYTVLTRMKCSYWFLAETKQNSNSQRLSKRVFKLKLVRHLSGFSSQSAVQEVLPKLTNNMELVARLKSLVPCPQRLEIKFKKSLSKSIKDEILPLLEVAFKNSPTKDVHVIEKDELCFFMERDDGSKEWVYVKHAEEKYYTYHTNLEIDRWRVCIEKTHDYPQRDFVPYRLSVCNAGADAHHPRKINDIKAHNNLLADLDKKINDAHQRYSIRSIKREVGITINPNHEERWLKNFIKFLEDHYEVSPYSQGPIRLYSLSPKIIEKTVERETVTTHYKNGVVFVEKLKVGSFYMVGKRIFPNGMVEEGKFEKCEPCTFVEGTRTLNGKTTYLFNSITLTVVSFKDNKAVIPVYSWMQKPQWKVFQKNGSAPNADFTLLSDSIEDVLLNNLDNSNIQDLIGRRGIPEETIKKILPLLFTASEEYPNPPIASLHLGYVNYLFFKAQQLDISLDVEVMCTDCFNSKTTKAYVLHWANYVYACNNVLIARPSIKVLEGFSPAVIQKYKETFFLTFSRHKEVLTSSKIIFNPSSFSPFGKFVHKLVFGGVITPEDKYLIPLLPPEDLDLISAVATIYQKKNDVLFLTKYTDKADHKSYTYLQPR